MAYPTYDDVAKALLVHLYACGGEAASHATYKPLADHFGLSVSERERPRNDGRGSLWNNMVQWGRRILKDIGDLGDSPRGVWRLSVQGLEAARTMVLDDLRITLRRVLAETTFETRPVDFPPFAGSSADDADRPPEKLGPRELRDRYERATWDDRDLLRARHARVHMPEMVALEFTDRLRLVLAEYVDPVADTVGHSLPIPANHRSFNSIGSTGLSTHARVSTVGHFGAMLVKAAAVVGVDRVVAVIAAWTRGEPLTYRTCRVAGLSIARSMVPAKGVSLIPLPLSDDELPPELPSGLGFVFAYLGRTVVAVDTIAIPALFRPDFDYVPDLEGVVTARLAAGYTFEEIRETLSLECNAPIHMDLEWSDYGELFALTGGTRSRSTPGRLALPAGETYARPDSHVTRLEIDESTVHAVSEDRIRRLLAALNNANPSTRVAVTRWNKSLEGNLTDQFIDLRIALEALFLPDNPNQQLAFTLATRGAWLLGEDDAGRRKAWRTLRKAYDAGSRAVHRGEVKETDGNVEILLQARDLCRKGLLHVLLKGRIRDWTDLVLNCSDSAGDSLPELQ